MSYPDNSFDLVWGCESGERMPSNPHPNPNPNPNPNTHQAPMGSSRMRRPRYTRRAAGRSPSCAPRSPVRGCSIVLW